MPTSPATRRASCLWTLVGSLGSILAPLLIGAIASNFGCSPGYALVAALLLVSAVFMVLFGPETRAGRASARPVIATVPGPGMSDGT